MYVLHSDDSLVQKKKKIKGTGHGPQKRCQGTRRIYCQIEIMLVGEMAPFAQEKKSLYTLQYT